MSDADHGSGRVLLVDNSGTLTARFGEALAEAGFVVETVESASACLERTRAGDVDAIVSEYALPDIDGVRLVRSIRLSYPLVPFILAPADGSGAVAGDAVAAGASGYVPRSADAETVVTRLEETLRQAAQRRSGESHHRYRHVIEMSPAPINVFDETGESIWCNDAVVDLLGLDGPEELIGHTIFEFIHSDDHDVARDELAEVIEHKQSTGPTEMRLQTKDGDVRYVRVATAVGTFLGSDIAQAIIIDVTEEKQRERQLQVLEQWLRHNIRNEVTVIHGTAESIEQGVADDVSSAARRIREHAAHLVEQANRERAVIDLLSKPPAPLPTDVTAVVEQQVATSQENFLDADIELTRAEPVRADAIPALGAAVGELIENAVRHSDRESPAVRVEVTRTDTQEAVVRVADDGPGIPESEWKHVLVDHEVTELDHGRGLGLVFVYWVARLSGGAVSFAENDPRGSVVTLTLPASDD